VGVPVGHLQEAAPGVEIPGRVGLAGHRAQGHPDNQVYWKAKADRLRKAMEDLPAAFERTRALAASRAIAGDLCRT
jgi:hypothetical protein